MMMNHNHGAGQSQMRVEKPKQPQKNGTYASSPKFGDVLFTEIYLRFTEIYLRFTQIYLRFAEIYLRFTEIYAEGVMRLFMLELLRVPSHC